MPWEQSNHIKCLGSIALCSKGRSCLPAVELTCTTRQKQPHPPCSCPASSYRTYPTLNSILRSSRRGVRRRVGTPSLRKTLHARSTALSRFSTTSPQVLAVPDQAGFRVRVREASRPMQGLFPAPAELPMLWRLSRCPISVVSIQAGRAWVKIGPNDPLCV